MAIKYSFYYTYDFFVGQKFGQGLTKMFFCSMWPLAGGHFVVFRWQ